MATKSRAQHTPLIAILDYQQQITALNNVLL